MKCERGFEVGHTMTARRWIRADDGFVFGCMQIDQSIKYQRAHPPHNNHDRHAGMMARSVDGPAASSSSSHQRRPTRRAGCCSTPFLALAAALLVLVSAAPARAFVRPTPLRSSSSSSSLSSSRIRALSAPAVAAASPLSVRCVGRRLLGGMMGCCVDLRSGVRVCNRH